MTRMERPVATMASSEPQRRRRGGAVRRGRGLFGGADRGVAQDDGQVGVAVAGVLPGPLPPGPAPVPARGRYAEALARGRPLRLAYADPPYPGRARLYRESPGLRWRSRPAAILECLAACDG